MITTAATLRVAHRGLPGIAPENSLAGFALAGQSAAHALEFDVRLTRDGVAVVMHDATVDRTTDGSGAVATMLLAEVRSLRLANGERVPTLAEALDLLPAMGVVADIKVEAAGMTVLDELRRRDLEARTVISSFRPEVLVAMRRAGTTARLAVSYPDDRLGISGRRFAGALVPVGLSILRRRMRATARRLLRVSGADVLSLYHPLLTEALVRELAVQGVGISAWTVNDIGRARELAGWGVESIVSDESAVLAALAAEEEATDQGRDHQDSGGGSDGRQQ